METKPIYVTNLDCAIIMWEARGVQIGHSLCAVVYLIRHSREGCNYSIGTGSCHYTPGFNPFIYVQVALCSENISIYSTTRPNDRAYSSASCMCNATLLVCKNNLQQPL
jgi:hypothetical protein